MLELMTVSKAAVVDPTILKSTYTKAFKIENTAATTVVTSLGLTRENVDLFIVNQAGTTIFTSTALENTVSIPVGTTSLTFYTKPKAGVDRTETNLGVRLWVNLSNFTGTAGFITVSEWADAQLRSIAFQNAQTLRNVPASLPDQVRSLQNIFYGNNVMNSTNVPLWSISKIKTIVGMCHFAGQFNQNLSGWIFPANIPRTNYDTNASAWTAGNKPKFTL